MGHLRATAATSLWLAALPGVADATASTQAYVAVDGWLGLSAAFGALPLAVLFLVLGGLRLPAKWTASVGSLFAAILPFVGWFSTTLTGSSTSTSALLGLRQVTTARATDLPAVPLAAAISSGGVM